MLDILEVKQTLIYTATDLDGKMRAFGRERPGRGPLPFQTTAIRVKVL